MQVTADLTAQLRQGSVLGEGKIHLYNNIVSRYN
jgi:hypothetical protein